MILARIVFCNKVNDIVESCGLALSTFPEHHCCALLDLAFVAYFPPLEYFVDVLSDLVEVLHHCEARPWFIPFELLANRLCSEFFE